MSDAAAPLFPIPQLDLERFLNEDFFSLLGIEDISEEEKIALGDRLLQTVLARTYAAAILQLPLAERDQAADMSPDDMIPFFAERGIDLTGIIITESVGYKAELAQLMLGIEAGHIPFGNGQS